MNESELEDEEQPPIEGSLRVGLVLHRGPDVATRVNTIPALMDMNRQVSRQSNPSLPRSQAHLRSQALSKASWVLPSDPTNRALIDQKAQISTDSIVGESTQISEKVTIKKSVIGRHCVIGKMVRIVGCVLFDHCVIEDG